MHILFLSHYFPPEVNAPASRTYEHCKRWTRHGHKVTVVTCAPNHPKGKVYEGYKNKIFQRSAVDGIDVIRTWTYVTANEGVVKRTLSYVSYMVSVILITPLLPKVDVVISTSPQFFNGMAGYFVSRLKRAPWILEIRDLWPESIRVVGAITNRLVICALEYLEMFVYRKADRIVPVTEAFRRHMLERGVPDKKIAVIKNGVDPAYFQPMTGDNPLVDELHMRGKFVVSYVGTHGMAHHLETILYAAKELQDVKDIVFLMVGDGSERDRLLALRDEMGLGNVVMIDQQPKDKMPYLWALSNVSLVLLKKSELFKSVIPSKIFESMSMKKPIILGVEGESKEIIEMANSGKCIEPENNRQLARTILELYGDPGLCAQLGVNGRNHVIQFYNRSVLAERFLSLIEAV